MKENKVPGKRMRHCERCEVPIGTMWQKEFRDRYWEKGGLCKRCGKPVSSRWHLGNPPGHQEYDPANPIWVKD